MKIRRAREAAAKWIPPTTVIMSILILWQIWVETADVKPWVLPGPLDVARAGWANRQVLAGNSWTTLEEAVVGLALGTALGLVTAFAIALVPVVRRALWPVVVASQTIPVIVLAPLVAVWFGYGLLPKFVLVALICFFPVAVAAASGLTGADPEHLELLRSFGAGRVATLRYVQVPGALVQIVAGVKIAAAYAVGDAVIGEYVGGTSGLGIFIDRSHSSYRTDQMIAGVAVIAVVSIALFTFTGFLGRLLTPWARVASTDSHLTQTHRNPLQGDT